MTPLGTPIDRRLFFVPEGTIPMDIVPTSTPSTTSPVSRRRGQGRNQASNGNTDESVGHNIDAGMLQQDFALVSVDIVLRGRVSASKGLGMLMSRWPNEVRKLYFIFTSISVIYVSITSLYTISYWKQRLRKNLWRVFHLHGLQISNLQLLLLKNGQDQF
jgi:hypothetical protein